MQDAAVTMEMSNTLLGFVVVTLTGDAAKMASTFSDAREDRLDLSVGVAVGSETPIAVFVAPVLIEPALPPSRRSVFTAGSLTPLGTGSTIGPSTIACLESPHGMEWLDAVDPGGGPGV